MPPKRRHRGEDSIYRTCHARYGCPDPIDGKRPEHGKSCRAPWAYAIDLGFVAGKRKRQVVTARTKPELNTKVEALKEKRTLGVSPTAQTVAGYLEYWVERVAPANGVRPTTLAGYKSKIDLYLKPSIGHIKLQDLAAEHVEAMEDWMRTLDKGRMKGNGAGKLSEATIRQTHMILRSALQDALTRRRVTYNAAAVVRAPKAMSKRHDSLELANAKTVLRSAASERDLCRLVVALALGLRQGEALGLRWDDYRIAPDGTATIVVDESLQRIGGTLTRTDVKSAASHRIIPVPERMVPIFEAWRALATDDYMFPGVNGGPCDPKRDWRDWKAALERAEVKSIPLHGARGSAASLLADMNVPDWRIAEILGHSSVITTRRHYIKSTEESHRVALGNLIGELLP